MAKDPAFLLYYQDFAFGTRYMSLAAKGAYIDILCHLADKHTISKEHIFIICQSSDSLMSEIMVKLVVDSNGEYYSERLRIEVEKRKSYAKSRRENRLKTANKQKKQGKNISKTYVPHMDNENEIEDVNDSSLKESEKTFLEKVLSSWQKDLDFQEAYGMWRIMLRSEHNIKFIERDHEATIRLLNDYSKKESIECLLRATQARQKTLYPQKKRELPGETKEFVATNRPN